MINHKHTPPSDSWFSRLLRVGLSIGVAVLLFTFFQPPPHQKSAEDLALGPYTSSYRATAAGLPIHCSTLKSGAECIKAAQQRGQNQTVLWFGNSQVHGINAYQAGQQSAAERLFQHFKPHNIELLTFSQANANLQEHYVLLEWVQAQLPITGLVIGLCYDDTREGDIRAGIKPALDHPETRIGLSQTKFGLTLLTRYNGDQTKDNSQSKPNTLQIRSEAFITTWLTDHSSTWRARTTARNQIFTSLFLLRNSVFNITPTSKRPKLPARYRDNLNALEALLVRSQSLNISVQLYIAPIRNDLPLPYDMNDYRIFKAETQQLAQKYGAHWTDLESIVPTPDWGEKGNTSLGGGGEVDFMHFKASGHHKLADHLKPLITQLTRASDLKDAP